MKKVSIIIHKDYLEDTIKKIHETGIFEIVNIAKEDPATFEEAEKTELHPEVPTCTSYELRITRLIDILKKNKKNPKGIKSILNPEQHEKTIIEEHSLEDIYSYSESILHEIEEKVIDFENKLNEINDRLLIVDNEAEQISYFKDFEIDLSNISETEFLFGIAGITSDLSLLKNELDPIDLVAIYHKQFGSGKKREWAVIIIGHISKKEQIEKIVREKITPFDFKNQTGTPKEVIVSLEKNKNELIREKQQIQNKLQVYTTEHLDDLLVTREEIYIQRIRKEILKDFAQTQSTYILKGWVMEKNEKELKELITNISKDNVIFSSSSPSINPDDPPIYFETPKWASSFRTFLELFASPKYNELNPTIFMGIFFIIFFALMLGDAGYGLSILFLSLFGFFKLGKNSSMIKTWSFLGILLGFSTTIIGFLMNSFFGDFIPRFFGRPIFSATIFGIKLPLEPLQDPLTILAIALIFGIIHLNLGIILGIIQSYHRRDFKTLITKHFTWIPLQIGGGMLVGNFLMGWKVEGVLFYIAAALTIIGLILLFVHAGPIGFFDITGYVGDWLSYARLLALGLATSGMALAFNVISELIGGMIPFVGIVIMAIVLVLAHTVNLGLQALGAGVHSLRLQYVEFFNRFYEGGGRQFSPFKLKRKYTKIEEK